MRPNTISVPPAAMGMPFMLGQGTAAKIATSAPSLAVSAAASAGLLTAPLNLILPGVGVVLGALIGGLFAAHAARVKGAKTENAVLNSLLPTVEQAITAVFDALNNGTATPTDAITQLQNIQQQYWQAVQQVEGGPGQAGGPGKCVAQTSTVGKGTTCDKSCTASCCIGCNVINEGVYNAIQLIQTGTAPLPWEPVVGNKYGLQDIAAPSWSYTPGAAASLTSASGITGLASSSFLGFPIWMWLAGLVAWKVLA